MMMGKPVADLAVLESISITSFLLVKNSTHRSFSFAAYIIVACAFIISSPAACLRVSETDIQLLNHLGEVENNQAMADQVGHHY